MKLEIGIPNAISVAGTVTWPETVTTIGNVLRAPTTVRTDVETVTTEEAEEENNPDAITARRRVIWLVTASLVHQC